MDAGLHSPDNPTSNNKPYYSLKEVEELRKQYENCASNKASRSHRQRCIERYNGTCDKTPVFVVVKLVIVTTALAELCLNDDFKSLAILVSLLFAISGSANGLLACKRNISKKVIACQVILYAAIATMSALFEPTVARIFDLDKPVSEATGAVDTFCDKLGSAGTSLVIGMPLLLFELAMTISLLCMIRKKRPNTYQQNSYNSDRSLQDSIEPRIYIDQNAIEQPHGDTGLSTKYQVSLPLKVRTRTLEIINEELIENFQSLLVNMVMWSQKLDESSRQLLKWMRYGRMDKTNRTDQHVAFSDVQWLSKHETIFRELLTKNKDSINEYNQKSKMYKESDRINAFMRENQSLFKILYKHQKKNKNHCFPT